MKKINNALKGAWLKRRASDVAEVTQTVILIAFFAVMAIATTGWLVIAGTNKAVDAAACAEGASYHFDGSKNGSYDYCKTNVSKQGNNSFTKHDTYTSRY